MIKMLQSTEVQGPEEHFKQKYYSLFNCRLGSNPLLVGKEEHNKHKHLLPVLLSLLPTGQSYTEYFNFT